MVYLLATVAYYRQLSRTNQAVLDTVGAELAELEGRFGYSRVSEREGTVLFQLGSEFGLDPWRVVEFTLAVHRALAAHSDDLFGFNLLVAVADSAAGPAAVMRQVEGRLLSVEEDEELWFDADSWALVSRFVPGEAAGGLFPGERPSGPGIPTRYPPPWPQLSRRPCRCRPRASPHLLLALLRPRSRHPTTPTKALPRKAIEKGSGTTRNSSTGSPNMIWS